mmetsp:Transcript_56913/g.94519  ORF Transcript_56913/g.94519 Transcript_56913/m.94519 type:complete len:344 (-) Transcript_56913:12-1043(-)
MYWTSCGGDDVRIGVCTWLWPQEWLGNSSRVCRCARDFLARRDVRISLLVALPENVFTLTSPLWKLLRHGVLSRALSFMDPAFAAMGIRSDSLSSGSRGGSAARLLGRCFALASQNGFGELVSLALKGGVNVDLRINGRSALDHASQAGHLDIVKTLLAAHASASQTAAARWTPLMYAALGGHADVCECLLDGGAPLDEHTERSTALDVAEANGHGEVTARLKARQAQRYLELRPGIARQLAPRQARLHPGAGRHSGPQSGDGSGRSTMSGRLRPGPARLGGGLPRGVLMGSVSLRLGHLEDDGSQEDGDSDVDSRVVNEEEEDIGSRLQRRFDLTLTPWGYT